MSFGRRYIRVSFDNLLSCERTLSSSERKVTPQMQLLRVNLQREESLPRGCVSFAMKSSSGRMVPGRLISHIQ